jgi:DNA end-binding protein Ku
VAGGTLRLTLPLKGTVKRPVPKSQRQYGQLSSLARGSQAARRSGARHPGFIEPIVELEPEELEAVALESTRMIDIEQFVPKKEIDDLYMGNPYYIVPDGEVGQQAFAVIRKAIEEEGMVAIGRVVFTSREHIIALEPRGKGMMGVTIRYPYEVRDEKDYFDDIPNEKITSEMLDLAAHIVETKQGHFHPEKFEDRYEA